MFGLTVEEKTYKIFKKMKNKEMFRSHFREVNIWLASESVFLELKK